MAGGDEKIRGGLFGSKKKKGRKVTEGEGSKHRREGKKEEG